MVHSHLVYCINIYSCANITSLNKLRLKQKEAVISNAGFRDHKAPLFAQLSILPLDQLIKLHILKFMHGFSHKKLPISFLNLWITNRERLPERILRNADLLYIPQHNFATIKRMPMLSFPSVWNEKGSEKKNPNQYIYLRNVKRSLLQSLIWLPLAPCPHPLMQPLPYY